MAMIYVSQAAAEKLHQFAELERRPMSTIVDWVLAEYEINHASEWTAEALAERDRLSDETHAAVLQLLADNEDDRRKREVSTST